MEQADIIEVPLPNLDPLSQKSDPLADPIRIDSDHPPSEHSVESSSAMSDQNERDLAESASNKVNDAATAKNDAVVDKKDDELTVESVDVTMKPIVERPNVESDVKPASPKTSKDHANGKILKRRLKKKLF
jgi:hypothetical protein